MPLDPQARTLIDQLAASGQPALDQISVAEARALLRNLAPLAGPAGDDPVVEDSTVPGPSGPIPVRLYRPRAAGPGAPLLIWLHGGGWVIGDLESADGTARLLSTGAGVVVASVDYPLAPEDPYPAGPEGCYAATRWLAEHAAELGADPGRVAIGGDSAGGNLAAVVALLARDRGGPDLKFQLLVYPCTDALMGHASMEENAEGYFLTRSAMQWFYGHYLGASQDVAKEPTVSPLYAEDLTALPPALVITAEFDPLRDEGEAYGRRLQEAGVPATVSRYEGQIHGFFGLTMVLDGGKRALREACVALENALGTSAP